MALRSQITRAAFDRGPWPRLAPAERIAAVRRIAEAYASRLPRYRALYRALSSPEAAP